MARGENQKYIMIMRYRQSYIHAHRNLQLKWKRRVYIILSYLVLVPSQRGEINGDKGCFEREGIDCVVSELELDRYL